MCGCTGANRAADPSASRPTAVRFRTWGLALPIRTIMRVVHSLKLDITAFGRGKPTNSGGDETLPF
ncbi:hypothetical protein ELS17_06665 [Natrinema altunense]|uniref:Uncharacterized protein n=1 Tax=Natrinema altunense TaxID=222984 RepID=A0A482Y7C1_9EURY|nr:hypothetical protein ELS17_06665 [Natrinema altunense]